MFNTFDSISLDELASNLEPIELDILKAYLALDKEVRSKLVANFRNYLK